MLVEGEADVPRGKRPLDQEKQIFTGQFSGGDNCLFDRAQARCDWNCQRPRGSPFRNRKWKHDLMGGAGAEASDIEKPGGAGRDNFSLQVRSGFGGTMS